MIEMALDRPAQPNYQVIKVKNGEFCKIPSQSRLPNDL